MLFGVREVPGREVPLWVPMWIVVWVPGWLEVPVWWFRGFRCLFRGLVPGDSGDCGAGSHCGSHGRFGGSSSVGSVVEFTGLLSGFLPSWAWAYFYSFFISWLPYLSLLHCPLSQPKASCLKSFPAPDLSDLQAPHGATWYDEDRGHRRSRGTMLGQCTTGKLLRLTGAQHRC